MAAQAAKYGHCEIRYPVEYRSKVPFRPELTAPLDLAVRAAEVYALDRELDRAVLGPDDYADLFAESVGWGLDPGDLLGGPPAARPVGPASAVPARTVEESRRDQFVLNELQFLGEGNRFRPPWTPALVQEVHALLLRGLEGDGGRPGELREEPFVTTDRYGDVLYRACPPDRIVAELGELLDWVDRVGPTMMPVVPATVLLHGFHTIRPFPRGNATVGAFLARYYLHLFGLPNSTLVPVGDLGGPFPQLHARLTLWTESGGGYSELLDFTMDRVLAAYRAGVDRWIDKHPPSDRFEETALRLLARARRTRGWFSAQEAASWVGGRSTPTVLRHLNDLVRAGVFESLGQTRAKRYRFVSPTHLAPALSRRFARGADTTRTSPPTPAGRAVRDALPSDSADH